MRTVRRLYFYLVTLISLEVVLWGLIGLARSVVSAFCSVFLGCGVETLLAQGLALILVGVPVFLFHWLMAQRFAHREMDERASGIRAAFLYGVLLGTLIPVVQNILALVNRPVLTGLQLASARAFVGGNQVWSDNIIAIFMNLLVAVYFFYILRLDWKVIEPKESFASLRRVYSWVWVLYGLGLTVTGVNQLLRFLLSFTTTALSTDFQRYWAVNGMVVALVGAPIWAYAWLTQQKALAEQAERESFLRLDLLYLLSLVGAVVTLATGGVIVDALLRFAFGLTDSFRGFIQAIESPLASCIPFLGIWLYYGHWLNHAMAEVTDAPRRLGMRRVYYYILSALGLTVVIFGLAVLLSFLVDSLFMLGLGGRAIDRQLTAALALLVVGVPLWLLTWRPMQVEALSGGDAGDHARRSITRKIYLYLALFAGVIGGMIVAVGLLNTLLGALFSGDFTGLAQELLKSITNLLLFVGLGVYHGLTLGRDGKIASSALGEKHAAFPVLIFDPGDGFGPAMLAAVQKATPRLPASLQAPGAPLPDPSAPRAVVFPLDLALEPPAPLRKWLDKYAGSRLVVLRSSGKWKVARATARLAFNETAQALRQLAEGQELHLATTPGWLIVVYVIAAIIALPTLVSIIGALISGFFR